ncbi:MAG: hypothetical protein LBJ80_03055 [Rickettsiales bacterium]|jgi:hypothetical protein|nr:hypothetical protein [Rickettsiales bacterium]MDR1261376.1 hypothetical protein [Rickettsiales bacterium]
MPIFKNHRGQFHKMNTALVALTSLYVIGAAAALSSPYWASSYPALAPLAAFAATPLGMGILAFVAIALTGLAIRAIIQNNEISELKAPKLIKDGEDVRLLVTRDVFEEMKKNNQVKDDNGNAKSGQYYIDFNLGDKNYRVIVDGKSEELGNTLLLGISSLKAKDSNGKYTLDSLKEVKKELSDKEGSWVNTYLGELSSVQPAASQGPGK